MNPLGSKGSWILGAALAAILGIRLWAIHTDNVNWDEFALLARAMESVRAGELQGGGRPGLGTLLLVPLIQECRDALAVVHRARWLWTGITVALVLGFWFLLRATLQDFPFRNHSALLGVALLVLVPVFMRWSIQVRTDQPAIALGLWGGVALLASRRSLGWAAIGGVLFGVGWLFTQKLVYVAALTGLLWLGTFLRSDDRNWGRFVGGGVLVAVAAGAVVTGFHLLAEARFGGSQPTSVAGGMSVFSFYRATLGYRVYIGMLPTLVPHVLLGALLIFALLKGETRGSPEHHLLLLSFAVLNLGGVVTLFHAAAFPYFWITLGLFPATAIALGTPALMKSLTPGRARLVFDGGIVLLVLVALPASILLLKNSQDIQAQSLSFIEENFEIDDNGFHPESALFCRQDNRPFPTYFLQHINRLFYGDSAEQNIAGFLEEFRERPVIFILDSYRLAQFPPEVQDFWNRAYVPYAPAVAVPGREVHLTPDAGTLFEVVVEGQYRWWPAESTPLAVLRVNGQLLDPYSSVILMPGMYELEALGRADGIIAMDLPVPPSDSLAPFYHGGSLSEFRGLPWWRVHGHAGGLRRLARIGTAPPEDTLVDSGGTAMEVAPKDGGRMCPIRSETDG